MGRSKGFLGCKVDTGVAHHSFPDVTISYLNSDCHAVTFKWNTGNYFKLTPTMYCHSQVRGFLYNA